MSCDIVKKCWRHKTHLEKHDEIDCIDLTPGIENMEEELAEIENTMAQLVPAHTRMTANNYLNLDEDEDCTDSLSPEELIASLADDIHKSIEGTEDSDQELQQITL